MEKDTKNVSELMTFKEHTRTHASLFSKINKNLPKNLTRLKRTVRELLWYFARKKKKERVHKMSISNMLRCSPTIVHFYNANIYNGIFQNVWKMNENVPTGVYLTIISTDLEFLQIWLRNIDCPPIPRSILQKKINRTYPNKWSLFQDCPEKKRNKYAHICKQ